MVRHCPAELWFRGGCRQEIIAGSITRTARLGVRTIDHPKGYALGERTLVRCFDTHGMDEVQRWVIIRALRVCRFDELAPGDLSGMPQVERALSSLAVAFVRHYQQSLHAKTVLTIIDFAYDGEVIYGDHP